MKEIWKKHRFVIIIVVYVIAISSLVYAANLLLVGKIVEKADKIQELNIDNQLNKKKLEKIPEMENANEEYKKDKDSLDVILSPSEDVDFIRSLEALAEKTGNKISLKIEETERDQAGSKTKTSKKKAKEGEEKGILELLSYDKYLQMQINLEGGYVNLFNFIRKLENSKYYVNIISIDSKKVEEQLMQEASVGTIFTPSNQNSGQAKREGGEIIKSVITIIVYKEE